MCLSEIGRVVAFDEAGGCAEIDTGNGLRRVMLVPLTLEGYEVVPGDWLVVHTGVAVGVLDAAEAAGILSARQDAATQEARGG